LLETHVWWLWSVREKNLLSRVKASAFQMVDRWSGKILRIRWSSGNFHRAWLENSIVTQGSIVSSSWQQVISLTNDIDECGNALLSSLGESTALYEELNRHWRHIYKPLKEVIPKPRTLTEVNWTVLIMKDKRFVIVSIKGYGVLSNVNGMSRAHREKVENLTDPRRQLVIWSFRKVRI
jgi:hypothetical protein